MAISVLNEWTYTKDSLTSEVVSMHSKCVLYYKGVKTNVAYSTVRVTYSTTIDETFNAFEIDEDATDKFFIVDFESILKYLLNNAGFIDELEFQSSGGGSVSKMIAPQVSFEINTYNISDVLQETLTINADLAHLAHEFPNESGFNLWEVYSSKNLQDLKWSNDTYNALFIHSKSLITIYNRTTGKSFNYTVSPDRFAQMKFEKRIRELYDKQRRWNIDAIDAGGPASQVTVLQSATGSIVNIKVIVDRVVYADDTAVSKYIIEPAYPVAKDGIKKHYEIDYQVPVPAAPSVNINPMGTSFATPMHDVGENIRVETEYNEDEYASILTPGKNDIEILINDGASDYAFASIEIDFDPYGCYIPLCWEHPTLGYVSYPFEGAEIEGAQINKITEVKRFLTTLIDKNALKEIQGFDSENIVTVSTTAEEKYWPLLKELYSSRFVYLFVGQTGDEDNKTNWVQVEVSGNYAINKNTNKNSAIFTIQLRLPQNFNIKY